MPFTSHTTREAAYEAVAELITSGLEEALAATGKASLLLSGGSTPAPAYKQMIAASLDWSKVQIGLVDERWVDEPDPASNEHLIRHCLSTNPDANPEFIPMKTDAPTAAEAVNAVNAAYEPFNSPDVVVLGMGPDGHTASWFPDSEGLKTAMSRNTKQIVAAINATGCIIAGDHTDRMTVTLPVVIQARHVILLITGAEKRAVLENTSAELPIHICLAACDGETQIVWAP